MGKKINIGVNTEISIYDNVAITSENISDYFTVTNGSYYFVGEDSVFTTNNAGINRSTATTTLTALIDIEKISFGYTYSSEANYDKFTLTVGGEIIENAVSGATTVKSYTGSLLAGDNIVFTYAKDSSSSKNGDKCTFYNMVCNYQVGTKNQDVSKNVLTIWIGDENGIARKVKKAWIGDENGIARLFFEKNKVLSDYMTTTELSISRKYLTATSVGNYAIFGGGYDSSYYKVVDAYDTSLTRSLPAELNNARYALASTTIGNYALFGGGYPYTTTLDVYDASLTKSTATELSVSRRCLAATSVGNYALFGGGHNDSDLQSVVDVYDSSLTKSITSLSIARNYLAATTVGDYALFGGGDDDSYYGSTIVDAYNTSLTRSTPTELSTDQYSGLAATTVGDYALFGGGNVAVINAYNTSLTRSTPAELSVIRSFPAATTVGNYAIFGGGILTGVYYATADAYNTSLTRSTPSELSVGRYLLAAATVGNYAIFGGGYCNDGCTSVVDVYQLTE